MIKTRLAVAHILFCVGFTTGCTAGDLQIKATEDLAKIELDQVAFEGKNIGRISLALSGKIPVSVDRLEVSLDQGASWKTIPLAPDAIQIQESCGASCPFSFAVTDLGARWPELQTMTGGETRRLILRGQGRFGQTPPIDLSLKKLPSGFRAISTWKASELSRSVKRHAASGYLLSSALQEAQPRQGAGLKQGRGVAE